MTKAIRKVRAAKKSITLRDVVVHMQGMEQRLTKRIDGTDARVGSLTTRVDTLTTRVDTLTTKVDKLEVNLTKRIDSLERDLTTRMDSLGEDLIATLKDTIKIRQHVGMPVPMED